MLVTKLLVEQALRRQLEPEEEENLEFLSLEAEALISGYVGIDYADTTLELPNPVVPMVAARMVARALKVNPDTEDLASRQTTTGPYSQTTTFLPEGRGNSVYISKVDKLMLKKIKPSITSVQLVSGRSA